MVRVGRIHIDVGNETVRICRCAGQRIDAGPGHTARCRISVLCHKDTPGPRSRPNRPGITGRPCDPGNSSRHDDRHRN